LTDFFLSDIKHRSVERAVSKNTKLLIVATDGFNANQVGYATQALRINEETVSMVLSAATLPG
jgi:hypothetical protein